MEIINFKPRNTNGIIDFQENHLINNVESKLALSTSSVAIIHIVCGTKTGLVYPSMPCIETLIMKYPERIIVVVDACQLRCKLNYIQKYINLGFIVLITGSKFYTGPPFSGAVLLPKILSLQIENHLKHNSTVMFSHLLNANCILNNVTCFI